MVQSLRVSMGVYTVGEVARVKTSTGTYKAVVVASGKRINIMYLCIFVGCY